MQIRLMVVGMKLGQVQWDAWSALSIRTSSCNLDCECELLTDLDTGGEENTTDPRVCAAEHKPDDPNQPALFHQALNKPGDSCQHVSTMKIKGPVLMERKTGFPVPCLSVKMC